METYQEEYRKIRREYTRLEKMSIDKNLSEVERDEAQVRMAQISGRMNFLRPHVEESARRIDELTDLRNDITVGRSRLDKATEIIRKYTDISDMTDEELKSINENLYQITNGEDFKHLKRENVPSEVAGLKAEYDDKAESFHNLYRQYEEFEEDFKKKDPQYVEKKDDLDKSKDKGTLEPEGTEAPKQENIETPEEKVEKEEERRKEEEKRKEEERERQEKIAKLEQEKSEIESKIKELQTRLTKLYEIINSGNCSEEELKNLGAEARDLLSQIKDLKARLKEIVGEIGTLQQESKDRQNDEKSKDEKSKDEKSKDEKSKDEKSKDEKSKDEKSSVDSQKDGTKEADANKSQTGNDDKQNPVTPQPGLSGNGFVFPQAPSGGVVYNNGGAVYSPSPAQTVGPITNGHNVDVAKVADSVAKDKQLKKKSKFVDKIKETAEKIRTRFVKEKEDKEAQIAEAVKAQEIAEKARMKNPYYEVLREEEKRHDAELQLLEFPHARVDGHYFYHTVQRDDKLQYVREPIEGMKITEETLKTKILQLQDKYGDEARDRQGKKLYRISDIVAREGKDRQDFFERRSLQQLLKDPDKIIKEYLRFSIGEARREKMIKLMCGLEAANTAQEAGLACIDGLHDSLFDLHGQRAKGPFLSTMDIRNAELLEPHRNKENDFLDFEDDLLDEDISQEEQQQPSVSTQKIEPAQEQQQPTTETPQAEQTQEQQQPTTETPKAEQTQEEQQPTTETPKAEQVQEEQQPATETPKAEQVQEEQQTATETPKAEQAQEEQQPATETPKAEQVQEEQQTATETPKAEQVQEEQQPATETPKAEQVQEEQQPATETPKAEQVQEEQQPATETPKAEQVQEEQQPATDTPKVEQAQEEQQPTTKTPKAEQAQDNIEEDTLDLREALTDKSQTDQDKLEITDDLPGVEQLKYDIPERDQDTASKENEETVDFDAGKAFEESEEKPRYNLYKDRVEYDTDAREYKRKEPILISERGRGKFRETSENAKSVAGRKHQNRSSRSRNGKSRDNDFGEII